VIKSRRMARTISTTGAKRVLVEKAEERRSLGRPRRRWENNIKMDFKEV